VSRKRMKELQDKILSQRGFTRTPRSIRQQLPPSKAGYTKLMLLIEEVLKIDLRHALFAHPDSFLAELFNVDKSTISHWRKRLREVNNDRVSSRTGRKGS